MKTGDLYLTELPTKKGHEQKGYRPTILIIAHADVNLSMIVPLTTNTRAKRFNNTVEITPDENNNLDKTSIALLFQLTTIDNNFLNKKIGKLSEDDLNKIVKLIKKTCFKLLCVCFPFLFVLQFLHHPVF